MFVHSRIEFEFGHVDFMIMYDFRGKGKTGVPGEKPLGAE